MFNKRPKFSYLTTWIIAVCTIAQIPGMYVGESFLPFLVFPICGIFILVTKRMNESTQRSWDSIEQLRSIDNG